MGRFLVPPPLTRGKRECPGLSCAEILSAKAVKCPDCGWVKDWGIDEKEVCSPMGALPLSIVQPIQHLANPLCWHRPRHVVLILNHVPTPCCQDDPSLDRKDKPGNDGGKAPKRSMDEKEVCFLLHPSMSLLQARAQLLVAAVALAVLSRCARCCQCTELLPRCAHSTFC